MSLNPSYPDAIYPLVQCINEAVQPPCPTSTENNCTPFKSEASRRKLIAAAEQLLLAARSPEENVFAIAQQPAQTTALRCAIALGIPDALPENGSPRSLDRIASEVGADNILLSRILRACTSTSLLAEASELHYAHNALSRALLSPANRALLALMFDYNARSIVALPEFLRARGWRDAGTYEDCAFMLGCRTALPMWEFRDRDPECSRVFDLGMQSEIVAALSTGKASGPFPFGEELKLSTAAGGNLTIVDLGGGRGQTLIDMREDHPGLMQGARLVLVDLGPVIDSAREAGLPPWVEPVKGSFFEPLPVRGADVYLLRRCLHNWDDAACRRILNNVAAAMDPARSRLLVTDMVVADTNAAREMAWEDLNMMTIGGIERTERHWRSLLDESGFHMHRIWSNSPVEHATIDARLK